MQEQELRKKIEEYYDQSIEESGNFNICGPKGRELYIQSIIDNYVGKVLVKLVKRINQNKDIKTLDYGCGLGGSVIAFEAEGFDGWGAEIETKAIEIAKLRVKNPEKIVKIAEDNLFFQDSTFDIVTSQLVIEHVENPRKYLLEAMRVLKPGGKFLILAPNYLFPWEGHHQLFWLPYILPITKNFFKLYVKLRGRDSKFIDYVNIKITPGYLEKMFKRLGYSKIENISAEVFGEKFRRPEEIRFLGVADFLRKNQKNILVKFFINLFIKTLDMTKLYHPIVFVVEK